MQGLLIAQQSGRNVDMSSILKHVCTSFISKYRWYDKLKFEIGVTWHTFNWCRNCHCCFISLCIKCYGWGMRSHRWTCTNSKSEKASRLSNLFRLCRHIFRINIFPFKSRSSKGRYLEHNPLKGLAQAKIIKESVILFWLLLLRIHQLD